VSRSLIFGLGSLSQQKHLDFEQLLPKGRKVPLPWTHPRGHTSVEVLHARTDSSRSSGLSPRRSPRQTPTAFTLAPVLCERLLRFALSTFGSPRSNMHGSPSIKPCSSNRLRFAPTFELLLIDSSDSPKSKAGHNSCTGGHFGVPLQANDVFQYVSGSVPPSHQYRVFIGPPCSY